MNENASAHGSELSKHRWKDKTEEERYKHASMMSRKYWDSLTKEQRTDRAKKAVANRKKKQV